MGTFGSPRHSPERSPGNPFTNHALKNLLGLCSPLSHAALCQTELLFSLYNLIDEILPFLLLSSRARDSSVTNAYPLGGVFFLASSDNPLGVQEQERYERGYHWLTPALTSVQMKYLTAEISQGFFFFFSPPEGKVDVKVRMPSVSICS